MPLVAWHQEKIQNLSIVGMIKKRDTYHVEQHGRSVKVRVFLSVLDLDCGENNTSTLDLNAG